jgi:hypothetical protein
MRQCRLEVVAMHGAETAFGSHSGLVLGQQFVRLVQPSCSGDAAIGSSVQAQIRVMLTNKRIQESIGSSTGDKIVILLFGFGQ